MRQLRVHHDNDKIIESIYLSICLSNHPTTISFLCVFFVFFFLFFFVCLFFWGVFSRYELTKVRLDLAGTS